MASVQAAPPARLKVRYLEEIRPSLISQFGYSSVMQAPRLQKITVNMGVGTAKTDSKVLRAASEQLATIAGQQPSVRRARKSIAAFKLREGNPVGVAVTLRGDRSYEFLDRLITIAIPRVRDFRGLNPRSFDGRGNYSMGVREQIIFPEIDYDSIDQVRGMDITITTSAATDAEAFALLAAFGLPFSAERRPKGFQAPDGIATPGGHASQARSDQDAEESEPQAAVQAPEAPAEGEPAPEAPSVETPEAPSAEAPEAPSAPEEAATDASEEAEEAPQESAEAEAAGVEAAEAEADPSAGQEPDEPSGEADGAAPAEENSEQENSEESSD